MVAVPVGFCLKAILVLVACSFSSKFGILGDLNSNGANVCHYVASRYVEVTVPFNATTYVEKVIRTSCGWWVSGVCTRAIMVPKHVLMYRKTSELQKYKVYHCCNGWSKASPDSKECTQAVCGVACQNGGTCIAPGQCFCMPGFQDKYCQNDIDECANPNSNQCSQICTNTYGSFSCSCRTGFQASNDGFTCTDIDECSIDGTCDCHGNDDVCVATCTNTQGSYSCKCSKGFELKNGKCQDRNECVENLSLCDQKCVNLPGMFKCECFPGFDRNVTTGKCEDADECSLNNGGCSQFCHNVVGGSVCSCKSGFFLDKDRKTCVAIQPPHKGVVLCEDGNHYDVITCPPNKKIGILYASFGRLSADYCQSGNYTTTTSCQSDKAMPHVDRSCNLRSACTLMASKKLYGDPCPGVSKYLQVVYDCL